MKCDTKRYLGPSILLLAALAAICGASCGHQESSGDLVATTVDATPGQARDAGRQGRANDAEVSDASTENDADANADVGNDARPAYFGGEVAVAVTEFDFGEALTDQVLTKLFKVRNVGSEELRIWKVDGS